MPGVTQIVTNESTGSIPTVGVKEIYTTGNTYFVDSNNGAATNNGLSSSQAVATLATAVALTTANNGDVILLMPGHAETIAAETTISTEGITVLGMGNGDNRPVITSGTATTAGLTIAADNVRISNVIFLNGIDSQAEMIDIADAAYTVIDHCQFLEGGSSQYLIGISITNAGADYCKILDCEFRAITAGPDSAIKIGEAIDSLEIARCDIQGDWSDAGIHNPTGKTALNLNIHDNKVRNDQTGDHAIELVSAVTGFLTDNRLYADGVTTMLDPGSLSCEGNIGSIGADTGGFEIPTGDTEAGNLVTKATATTPQGADGTLFTVTGGQVEILQLVGEVTTAIESATNISKLKFNPTGTGADVNLCQDLEWNALAVGTLFSITGNPNDVMQSGLWITQGMSQPIILGPGVIELECDGSTSGSVGWQLLYRPLEAGASVA
jgi:hypothetical protein